MKTPESSDKTVMMTENDMWRVYTPHGLVLISTLRSLGTQVVVYDNPDANPVGMIELRESTHITSIGGEDA